MLAFFSIALAFSLVVQSTNTPHNDTTILLDKRNNLTLTYDGTIDYEKTAMTTTWDLARRAGGNPSFFGKLKQTLKAKIYHKVVVTIPLFFHEDYDLLNAKISVGNPANRLIVAVDTGTGLFWVTYKATRDSKAEVCKSKETGPFLPRYPKDGRPEFHGIVYDDVIDVGGMKGVGRVIKAGQLKPPINGYDGVLGLSLSTEVPKTMADVSPFVTSFLPKHCPPIFALYLSTKGSVMHICGIDGHFHVDSIEYHPITRVTQPQELQSWQVGGASIYVNGREHAAVSHAEIVVDTGTSKLFGPGDQVEAVYEAIRGKRLDNNAYNIFPCDGPHNVVIKWDKKEWRINPRHFNRGPTDRSRRWCEGVLEINARGENKWTMGTSSIMDSVYAVFDASTEPPRFGFDEQKPLGLKR